MSIISRPGPRRPDRFHPLVTDLDRWAAAIDAIARQHLPRLLDLVSEGAIIPLREGTPVEVEEDLATLVLVRVRSGESAGRRGWLPSALLRHFAQGRVAA